MLIVISSHGEELLLTLFKEQYFQLHKDNLYVPRTWLLRCNCTEKCKTRVWTLWKVVFCDKICRSFSPRDASVLYFFFFLNVPAWCIDLQATSVAIWTFLWMKKHKLLQTLFPKTANKNTFCFHVLQQKCSLDLDTKDFVNTFFWKAYSSDWSALWFHENEISVVYKQNYSIFFSESLEFSPLVST